MVVSCAAYGCSNHWSKETPEIRFHRFPFSKPDILRKWISAVRREKWTPSKFSCLCSVHFTEGSYQVPLFSGKLYLKEDAVPEIFNYPQHLTTNVKKRKPLICRPTPVESQKEKKKSTPRRQYRKKLKERSPSPVLDTADRKELESESLGRDDVRIEKPLLDRTEDLEDELAQIKAGLKHLMEEDPLHEPVPDIVEELEPERTTFTSNKKSKKETTGSLRHGVESPEEMTVATPHQPINKISELSQKHSALLSESRRKLLAINRGVNRMLLPPTQHIVKPSALLRPLVERIGMTPIQSPRRPPQTVLNQTQNSFSQRADSIQRSSQNIAPKPSACVAPIQPSVSGSISAANQPSICSYVSPRKRLKLATDISETSKRSPHLSKLLDNLITLEEDIFSDDPDIQVIENTTGSLKKMRVNAAVQTDNSLVERKVLELQQKLAEKDKRIQQLEKSLATFVQPGNLVCETNDKTSDSKYTIVW